MKRQEIALPWMDANVPETNERCLSLKLNLTQFALDNMLNAQQQNTLFARYCALCIFELFFFFTK